MTESKGKAAKVKGNPDIGLILLVKPIVCEINEFLKGGLLAAETKVRDKAACCDVTTRGGWIEDTSRGVADKWWTGTHSLGECIELMSIEQL